jgi:hypothetical protein
MQRNHLRYSTPRHQIRHRHGSSHARLVHMVRRRPRNLLHLTDHHPPPVEAESDIFMDIFWAGVASFTSESPGFTIIARKSAFIDIWIYTDASCLCIFFASFTFSLSLYSICIIRRCKRLTFDMYSFGLVVLHPNTCILGTYRKRFCLHLRRYI